MLPEAMRSEHSNLNRTFIDGQVTIEVSFSTAIAESFLQVLPRAAFFDKRARGNHKNVTVVLVHLNTTVKLVACKVDGYLIKAFQVKSLKLNPWLHQKFSDCTHDNVLIFCYDTPSLNNSKVSLAYENPDNISEHIAVESEHPLFFPKQRNSRSTMMVCTTVFDTPPHFGAWIRYQKTLGVDMIHINAQESFLSSNSFTDPFFLESLRNGFIQLTVWKDYLPPGAAFYHSQALYYQNCLYRYLGVYEYCICADTDDFLISIDDKDFGVHKLIKKIFNRKLKRSMTDSASLNWIRYLEPAGGFDPPEVEIEDGNLTRYVSTSVRENEGLGRSKSIYKLSAMIELGIHESIDFLSTKDIWKRFSKVSQTRAYVAHIKKNPRAKDKKLVSCSDI